MNSYNELEYWSNREGFPNSDRAYYKNRLEEHSSFIRNNIFSGCSIFEFGSGDGRLLFAYDSLASLVFSYDISGNWRNQCIEESKKYSFKYIHFVNSEIRNNLSRRISQFDIVIASLVLMHQKPSRIVTVMSELSKIGKYVIVISKYDPGESLGVKDGKKTSYNYDYPNICRENRWKYTKPIYNEEQIYFCYGEDL